MFELLPYTLREIPIFNRLLVVPINFVVIVLLFTIFQNTKLKDKKSLIFFLMGVFMLIWVDFAYLGRLFGLYTQISVTFLKVAWVATPPVFYCTYLLSVYLMESEKKMKVASIVLLILTVVLSFSSAFTNLVIAGIKFTGNTLDIVYGVGIYFFLVSVAILIIFTVIPLFFKKPSVTVIYFFVGLFIFYIANFVFNITLPIFLNVTHYYYFGDYSSAFLLAFTTYAIWRHQLFDVRTFATEVFTMILWSILFTKMFVVQSAEEFIIDLTIFIGVVVFGVFLINSVKNELKQKQRLQELTEQLKELDAKKDEFLSIATHELRAPMTAIRGYISMILEGDAGEIPQEANNFLQVVQSSADRLIRLVNNMLNIARIEQGRQVYQMGTVQMTTVVNTIFSEFKLDAQKKGLKYTLEITPGVQDTVYVDQDRIHEVVANLISNAIKYTDAGSVTVRLFNQGSSIRFEVVDTGKGIAPEDQTQLFQKYYRVQDRMERKTGTGLGLYISKILIEKFGGKIGIQTALGHGSTFWFEIPCFSHGQDFPKTAV